MTLTLLELLLLAYFILRRILDLFGYYIFTPRLLLISIATTAPLNSRTYSERLLLTSQRYKYFAVEMMKMLSSQYI